MSAASSREIHLAVCSRPVRRARPGRHARVFPIQAVADAAGVHRSTLYRHWATTTELHDDLLRLAGHGRAGWQRRILDADPSLPAVTALADAVDGVTAELAIALRRRRSAASRTGRSAPRSRDGSGRGWMTSAAGWRPTCRRTAGAPRPGARRSTSP